MEVGKKKWVMKRGDFQHILPNVYHRFTGLTDAEIVEFSTQHSEKDSYRKTQSEKIIPRRAYDYDEVASKGIKMDFNAPIITGRSFEQTDTINPRIVKGHPIYFNPITRNEKTFDKEVKWKAEMINRLKIEEFYEDNVDIVNALVKLCSKCKIIKV